MTDLFTTPHQDATPSCEIQYRDALINQHAKDLEWMRDNGIIPIWLEDDQLLDSDEYAILSLVANHGGFSYDLNVIAEMIGFESTGNAKASIKKCLARKLIRIHNISATHRRVSLTDYGSWMLDEVDA